MRIKNQHCKHFNGTTNKRCEAGVVFDLVILTHEPMTGYLGPAMTRSMPCDDRWNPGGAICEKREYPSEAEIEAEKREDARCTDLMKRGLSSCCEAPIDKSQVILSGPHKGHGPRFCSKCRRCVFIV